MDTEVLFHTDKSQQTNQTTESESQAREFLKNLAS